MNTVVRTKERIKRTAEVMTPPWFVSRILDNLVEYGDPHIFEDDTKTTLDPACGNGNFLWEVLRRKLEAGQYTYTALSCIYGTDIMPDNIIECRLRLLDLVSKKDKVSAQHISIVSKNIIWIDPSIHPMGALSYHFGFQQEPPKEQVFKWLLYFNAGVRDLEHFPCEAERYEVVDKKILKKERAMLKRELDEDIT